jgi:hypothetical protein
LSSISITAVVVIVVVVHRAVAINVVVVVVIVVVVVVLVVHRAIVLVVVAVHLVIAIVVVDVVSTATRMWNSPPPLGPSSSPPPCDSPSSPRNCCCPPPLPRFDKDGEVVGGTRWVVVVASPEFDGDYEDPISLRASCAIACFCRMILFIAVRLPTLPLPLLFGSRFSANDPRCSSSCSALPPTPSSSSTTSELFCEVTSTSPPLPP